MKPVYILSAEAGKLTEAWALCWFLLYFKAQLFVVGRGRRGFLCIPRTLKVQGTLAVFPTDTFTTLKLPSFFVRLLEVARNRGCFFSLLHSGFKSPLATGRSSGKNTPSPVISWYPGHSLALVK